MITDRYPLANLHSKIRFSCLPENSTYLITIIFQSMKLQVLRPELLLPVCLFLCFAHKRSLESAKASFIRVTMYNRVVQANLKLTTLLLQPLQRFPSQEHMLGFEPRPLSILSKCSTTEPHDHSRRSLLDPWCKVHPSPNKRPDWGQQTQNTMAYNLSRCLSLRTLYYSN